MGGLNGRPEKLEDVCYSWWVLTSLKMIGKVHWIDCDALIKFILSAQVGSQCGESNCRIRIMGGSQIDRVMLPMCSIRTLELQVFHCLDTKT